MVIPSLSEELQIKAFKEVNEINSRIPEDLNHIREWLKTKPQLNARTDDLWLLNYLRGCKFNLERTKEKLELYYTSRTSLPAFFTNRDPFLPEIQEVLESGIFLPLTSETHTTFIILWKNANSKKLSLINILKVGLMLFEISLNENNTFIINGQQIIDDFKGFPLCFTTQVNLFLLRKIVNFVQGAYPLRIQGFHCTNIPFHYYTEGESDKIHEVLPISLIPKEYGGEGPSVSTITDMWKKKVESYRDWFLDDAKSCANETKSVS